MTFDYEAHCWEGSRVPRPPTNTILETKGQPARRHWLAHSRKLLLKWFFYYYYLEDRLFFFLPVCGSIKELKAGRPPTVYCSTAIISKHGTLSKTIDLKGPWRVLFPGCGITIHTIRWKGICVVRWDLWWSVASSWGGSSCFGSWQEDTDLSGGGLLPTASSLINTAGLNQVNPTTMPDCFELPFVLYFLFGPMVGF